MENKNDWHYEEKTRPLLTKRKIRIGNIDIKKQSKFIIYLILLITNKVSTILVNGYTN